jgi:hypothetical protein
MGLSNGKGWSAPAAIAALAALGPAAAIQAPAVPQDPNPSVEQARERVLERVEASLDRARTRLHAEMSDGARADEAIDALRTGLRSAVRATLRGPRPPEVERPRYAGRLGDRSRARVEEGGFGTDKALSAALRWLARHQDPDGRWSAAKFRERCKGTPCEGPGDPLHDVGVTGLALLAFLGDGNSATDGAHSEAVAKGVHWLLGQQDARTGLIGPSAGDRYLYGHAIGTAALAEACVLSGTEELRQSLTRALVLIQSARNPLGGWRYQIPPNGESDSSVTGWVLLALRGAADAGLPVDAASVEAGLAWLERSTDPSSGRCGYRARGGPSYRPADLGSRFPPDRTEANTALSLWCRFFHRAERPGDPLVARQADLLRKCPPTWERTPKRCLVDESYWYFGTLAAFHVGGEDWEAWNFKMKKALLENQRRDGDAGGSWDPIGVWGGAGGRVAMTALCAMDLEVYHRYGRVPLGR